MCLKWKNNELLARIKIWNLNEKASLLEREISIFINIYTNSNIQR